MLTLLGGAAGAAHGASSTREAGRTSRPRESPIQRPLRPCTAPARAPVALHSAVAPAVSFSTYVGLTPLLISLLASTRLARHAAPDRSLLDAATRRVSYIVASGAGLWATSPSDVRDARRHLDRLHRERRGAGRRRAVLGLQLLGHLVADQRGLVRPSRPHELDLPHADPRAARDVCDVLCALGCVAASSAYVSKARAPLIYLYPNHARACSMPRSVAAVFRTYVGGDSRDPRHGTPSDVAACEPAIALSRGMSDALHAPSTAPPESRSGRRSPSRSRSASRRSPSASARRRPSTASPSRSTPAASTASSDRTAPARRRRSR